MRYLEIPSKIIFRFVAGKTLKKIQKNSLENTLKNSLKMIDPSIISELKDFVRKRQTPSGGFSDKGGNADVYYTLFGCFVAEALEIKDVMPSLKKYVIEIIDNGKLTGVNQLCAIILFNKLCGNRKLLLNSDRKTDPGLLQNNRNSEYFDFLSLLALYYSDDYKNLLRLYRKVLSVESVAVYPCSVTAAHIVIQDCFRTASDEIIRRLNSFYRSEGSFSAVNTAPTGDLLSTSVALYTLKFIGYDTSVIKPDCMNYVDSLYSGGGFCATILDHDPDIEYTFYGLLSLGSLSA
jgi:hypothetical protein